MCQLHARPLTGSWRVANVPPYIVVFSLDTTGCSRHNPQQCLSFGWQTVPRTGRIAVYAKLASRLGGQPMQYLPGFTVQCINPQCDARGHWLRADATGPISDDGRCPGCGDFLRNVPPPLGPRFRMRPRPLTARPPLRPRFR